MTGRESESEAGGWLACWRQARLTDGHVLLRSPRDSDVAAIFDRGQSLAVEQTQWLPIRSPCSWAAAQRLVAESRKGWEGRYGLTLVVADPSTKAFAGVITLARHGPDLIEVAYGVAPGYRSKGIATRAVRLLVAWANEELGVNRFEICAAISNVASQRVAEKAGFARGPLVRTLVRGTGREHVDMAYSLEMLAP